MVPTQQRLEGGDPLFLQIDERLVVEFQLVAVERPAQLVFELAAVADDVAQFVRIEGIAAPASRLGVVKRDVGDLQELVVVAFRWSETGRCRSGPDYELMAVDQCRLGDLRDQVLGEAVQSLRSILPGTTTTNSSPPKRQAIACSGMEERMRKRDRAQQLVADGVAERVVDVLEIVEIDKEEGARLQAVDAAEHAVDLRT